MKFTSTLRTGSIVRGLLAACLAAGTLAQASPAPAPLVAGPRTPAVHAEYTGPLAAGPRCHWVCDGYGCNLVCPYPQ